MIVTEFGIWNIHQKAPRRIQIQSSPTPTLGESGNRTVRVVAKYEYNHLSKKKHCFVFWDRIWRVWGSRICSVVNSHWLGHTIRLQWQFPSIWCRFSAAACSPCVSCSQWQGHTSQHRTEVVCILIWWVYVECMCVHVCVYEYAMHIIYEYAFNMACVYIGVVYYVCGMSRVHWMCIVHDMNVQVHL